MCAWHHNLVEGHVLGTDFEDVLVIRVSGFRLKV